MGEWVATLLGGVALFALWLIVLRAAARREDQ